MSRRARLLLVLHLQYRPNARTPRHRKDLEGPGYPVHLVKRVNQVELPYQADLAGLARQMATSFYSAVLQ